MVLLMDEDSPLDRPLWRKCFLFSFVQPSSAADSFGVSGYHKIRSSGLLLGNGRFPVQTDSMENFVAVFTGPLDFRFNLILIKTPPFDRSLTRQIHRNAPRKTGQFMVVVVFLHVELLVKPRIPSVMRACGTRSPDSLQLTGWLRLQPCRNSNSFLARSALTRPNRKRDHQAYPGREVKVRLSTLERKIDNQGPVIAAILLLIGLCQARTAGRDLSKETSVLQDDVPYSDNVDDADSKKEESEEDQMPILPPIILLDFGNGTEEENATSEEKSKRTVNNGLGYGLENNSLQPKRYNYYFPAGKSGTTVSIEESISPFLPKTIVERVQPTNQRGHLGTQQNSFASSFASSFAAAQAQAQVQAQSQQNLRYLSLQQFSKSQGTFGLRTKPQKTAASSSFSSFQNFAPTAKPQVGSFRIQNSGYRGSEGTTTQSPLAYSTTETVRYVTPDPVNFGSPQSSSFSYTTASPHLASANSQSYASQRQQLQSSANSHSFGTLSQSAETSTVSPLSYNSHFASSGSPGASSDPKYTVENGLRYENKIFWKYPDGRVSEVPPATYVETYGEYSQQDTKPQQPDSIYETSTENSVLSQGPVQFPPMSDQIVQEPNQYVSSESLSSSLPQQQAYRIGYQNLLGQRQNLNVAQQRKPANNLGTSYSFSFLTSGGNKLGSSAYKTGNVSPYQQTTSRYMVNSPNPEYTDSYTTEPTVFNSTTPVNFYTRTESSPIASKYTPKVQSYLDTVLRAEGGSKKQNLGNNNLNSYSNLQYSDLLNYNPSISEYIRNPQSILNVRPTFVQAGNSLIPVIILRVDGIAPIQSKTSQNINLKALLQQYLIQYANSIQELAQPSTYDLGQDTNTKEQRSGPSKSPVLDLIRLTQEDAKQPPSYMSNSYVGGTSYETSQVADPKDYLGSHYIDRVSGRQKVKNVQILDDPRFTTYKATN
ncbi:uncharacterized protein LOC143181388 [Calliopsis andreniformis]|uniref:uncharacterized protein LOC143181388 n=1 Tax=Calliopsis andreniformis TaxID=337506 RepID=UPI003FCE8740